MKINEIEFRLESMCVSAVVTLHTTVRHKHAYGFDVGVCPPPHPQVVAPVRATCAQTLGMVVRLMNGDHVSRSVGVLLVLAGQQQWEVRHASLMGIQYLLAARTVSAGEGSSVFVLTVHLPHMLVDGCAFVSATAATLVHFMAS